MNRPYLFVLFVLLCVKAAELRPVRIAVGVGVAVGVVVGVGVPIRGYGVVVNVLSLPYLVPAVLVATIRKWYLVLALQAADVSSHILVRVAGLGLIRRGVPVAGRCAILEMDSRGQPMRID